MEKALGELTSNAGRSLPTAAEEDGADDEDDEERMGMAVGGGASGRGRGSESHTGACVPFVEELYAHGRVVGELSGVLRLLDLPQLEQVHYGTLTESGISFTGPAVVGVYGGGGRGGGGRRGSDTGRDSDGAGGGGGGGGGGSVTRGGGDGAPRLAPLLASMSRALRRGDEGARQASALELGSLLRSSHKESLVCFVFRDVRSLHACRSLMLDLWEELLSGLESRSLGFAARSDCYSLIRLLLARAEIGCTLHDAGSGGVGQTPLSHLIRWRVLVQRTLAWVLLVVGEPPAGGDGPALRDFCAHVMASAYFRLPHFGYALLTALQSEDVLSVDIPELRGGMTFTLDCVDELPMFAQRGFSEHPPLDWRFLHERVTYAVNNAAALSLDAEGPPDSPGGSHGSNPPSPRRSSLPGSAASPARPAAPNVVSIGHPVHESGSEGSLPNANSTNSLDGALSRTSLDASFEAAGGGPTGVGSATDIAALLRSTYRRITSFGKGGTRKGSRGGTVGARRRRGSVGGEHGGRDDVATSEQVVALRGSDELLAMAMSQGAWRQRMRKRGHMFCRLHWEWIQEVCDSLDLSTPPHYVAWQRLPGFKTMLICMLIEMRDKPIVHYSEPLVQLSNQLLRVTHLHSLLVKIVFLKASVHDVCAVSTTLNLLGSWMTSLAARLMADARRSREQAEAAPVSQPLLRSTFDFAFFFKGMATIFDSEHAQVLLKGIEFLYRHFDLLPESQANELRTLVLAPSTDRYWRLVLHWSPAVRKFFLHLLVYRLRRPCCWSMAPGGQSAVTAESEIPPPLAAEFDRRATRLAQIAQERSAGLEGGAPAEAEAAAAPAKATPLAAAATGVELGSRAREMANAAREMLDGISIPRHLRVYAPAAHALYVELDAAQTRLEAEMHGASFGAADAAFGHWAAPKSDGPASLPTLRWDTSVLDFEEDRVIWVRESDLGQAVREAPEWLPDTAR